mmetsp:Transcript_2535/g.3895  ORF Transcript_2535/g.3895 Transcript_2535/m.3895 type:complete len:129 (-) Transcript_2535:664-1050(-)
MSVAGMLLSRRGCMLDEVSVQMQIKGTGRGRGRGRGDVMVLGAADPPPPRPPCYTTDPRPFPRRQRLGDASEHQTYPFHAMPQDTPPPPSCRQCARGGRLISLAQVPNSTYTAQHSTHVRRWTGDGMA